MITIARVAVLSLTLALVACSAPSVPGDFIEAQAGVEYYPACGNEILQHEGVTWYPIDEDWPGPIALESDGFGRSVPRVAAPGEGDDIGTLWVYEDGFAYFRSNSGDLETWLTVREQTYDWVC